MEKVQNLEIIQSRRISRKNLRNTDKYLLKETIN